MRYSMNKINFKKLITDIGVLRVERPNKSDYGTLSGHAAGEPFENCVYMKLRGMYPEKIFK